jgi:hypothetical protein
MVKALGYAKYALRHNWTPRQVDHEVYAWLDNDNLLLNVENLLEEVASERSRRPPTAPGRPG